VNTTEIHKICNSPQLLADESGVYIAHKKVVRRYNVQDGEITWEYTCPGGRQASISGGYEVIRTPNHPIHVQCIYNFLKNLNICYLEIKPSSNHLQLYMGNYSQR
jgi:hypothetical protein